MGLDLETLSAADIPQNIALARAVGWPDSEADWRVIHDSAFVLGVRREGTLIAHGALCPYNGAGTIAKMVIAPSAQRQGIGRALLDALLTEAARRSLTSLGLVATAFGRALYESRGFVAVGDVAVLSGTPSAPADGVAASPVTDPERIVALEQRFFACSRTKLLRARLREASVSAVVLEADGAARGFALALSSEPYLQIGPVIANDEATARTLLRAILRAASGPVRIDVPVEQSAFRRWLQGLGLSELGVRPEMARGGGLPWRVPQRFALASQAWG